MEQPTTCRDCGSPLRLLLTSYYCPNECDKKAVCEAKPTTELPIRIGQFIQLTEYGAEQMNYFHPADIRKALGKNAKWRYGDSGVIRDVSDQYAGYCYFEMYATDSLRFRAYLPKVNELFAWTEEED